MILLRLKSFLFVGFEEPLNSPDSSDRTKKILAIEQKCRSYKHLLTPHNLLRSGLWREQGTLSVELLFIRRGLSTIFPGGTDLLVPLSDSERRLAEVLLSQPEKMVSTEEALKKMQVRVKKRKAPSAAAASSSPLSSPPKRAEKRKDAGPSEGRNKEKRLMWTSSPLLSVSCPRLHFGRIPMRSLRCFPSLF